MKKIPDNFHSKAHAGFSLVDVMVGMVIALLGIIVIFQVFSVSEGIKRTTTSGGDALQNGAAAMLALERSLQQAGYGFFSPNNVNPIPSTPVGTALVTITAGAANASDSIALTYRQDGRQAVAGAPCSTVAATGLPNWNYSSFPPDSAKFPLIVIPALTVETISVNVNAGGQAQLCSDVNGVIADGVVLMKAEYGINTTLNPDGTPDGVVNIWSAAPPANVLSVYAVRLAVVTRSAQPEATRNAAGQILPPAQCATTTVYPTSTLASVVDEFGNAGRLSLSGNFGLAAGDDWKCYRYKTFENTVALRN